MMERPSLQKTCNLKRTALRAGIALLCTTPNPFMRPGMAINHPDQRPEGAQLPVLVAHSTPTRPPQIRPTSITQITLSP